jgi:hypothetical protein
MNRFFLSICIWASFSCFWLLPSVVADDVTVPSGGSADLPEKCVPTEFQEGHPGPTDIFFLSDTTGSMAGPIANVQAQAVSIYNDLKLVVTDLQVGAGEYKDKQNCPSDPFAFRVDQSITSSAAAFQAGVNAWGASGGCDEPESYINALKIIGDGTGIGWRSGTTKIVVWFGDAPSLEPNFGFSRADAISALNALGIKVLAINTGAGRLDLNGQASAITAATGGELVPLAGSDLSTLIKTKLIEILQSTITLHAVGTCDKPGVTLTFPPPEGTTGITIPTGDEGCFHGKITADAVECTSLHATCSFKVLAANGDQLFDSGPITVEVTPVADTTPPSLSSSNSALSPCLWPPNHKYYYFTDLTIFNSAVVDNCPGPITISVASCTSSQPDNTHGHNRRRLLATGGNQGDGETTADCVFEGGILKVRAERSGENNSPRVYTVSLTYTDSSGNKLTTTNTILVPKNGGDAGSCLQATH